MTTRRRFIQHTSSIVVGSLLLGKCTSTAATSKNSNTINYDLGVQLFTLMAVIDQDTKGTLKKLVNLGYKTIESAFSRQGGFYGQSAKAFAALAQDLGLSWQAHHVIGAPFKLPPDAKIPTDENGNPIKLPAMLNLKNNMQQLVDETAEGGVKYLVCANIPTNTVEEVAEAVEILNKTGEACQKAGLQLVYHNHDWEFKKVGETTPYEVFLTQVSADLMKMELDLAWVTKAGVDPLELFEKHPGRFPLWHVKDIAADMLTLKPVGQGTVDFKRIFAQAEQAGLQFPFVEHDMPTDGITSLKASIEYLKTEIFA